MAIHTYTTPEGVNELGVPALRLLRGAVPVPTPDLTAETVAMLDAMPAELPPAPAQERGEVRTQADNQLSIRLRGS